MPMPGDPGFGAGPDLRRMAAKQRSIDTRRRILQPDQAPRFQGSGPGIAPPSRGRIPTYAQSQGQAAPGGGGLSTMLEGPGNWVRDKLGSDVMDVIRNVGPLHPGLQAPYQATRLLGGAGEGIREAFGDVVTDPYSYLGGWGGGAARGINVASAGRRGLNYVERLLSRGPRPQLSTGDRGPATVQSMIADIPETSRVDRLVNERRINYPHVGTENLQNEEDALARFLTEEHSYMDDPWSNYDWQWRANRGPEGLSAHAPEPEDELADIVDELDYTRQGHPGTLRSDEIGAGLRDIASNDVTRRDMAIEDLRRGGVGVPDMSFSEPMSQNDRLARMLMEHLGGNRRNPGLQGVAPLGALGLLGGGGGYGWQQQQRQPSGRTQQAIRRRMPYMLSDNWR